jgi:hypothetical protein
MPSRPRKSVKSSAKFDVAMERRNFHSLLAINPNYFGTVPGFGFPNVLKKQGDTTYEALSCVSFSPERDRLEATIEIRRPFGYSGNLCSPGSHEHVRFYVSYDEGANWTDAGMASVSVHDVPEGTSCDNSTWPPLSYVCGVDLTPLRNWCGKPVLPLVRAILSWEVVPDPDTPDQVPIWGDVRECHIQIRARRFFFHDIVAELPKDIVLKLPPYLLEELPKPIPDPGPFTPLPLSELVTLYSAKRKRDAIPQHRFVLPHLTAAKSTGAQTVLSYLAPAQAAQKLKIDLSEILKQLESTSGDTTYEELECVGLDNNAEQLVGTFRVKRPSGFSGGPCTAGSTEYVAYWADFGDDCAYSYLGTVEVKAHDYDPIPAGGLCYAAPLPVDLGKFRRDCDTPVVGRVRAVLSWGSPPSTTDPNAIPHWGNRLDVHVQLRPGQPYDGTARITILGGVASASVDLGNGKTLPGAAIAENGFPLPNDCPFAGVVTMHGPLDPALAGQLYRIRVRNVTSGGALTDLTDAFFVVNAAGVGSWVTPGAGGWTPWPNWTANTTGKLGHFTPGGDDLWEVQLELFGVGTVDVRRVQMDNTLNAAIVAGDPDNAADLHLNTLGACRLPRGPLTGTFVARDRHFHSWSIGVAGGPGTPIPATPLTVVISASTQTSLAGEPFTIDLSALEPCGYVVRLGVTDRAVVSSASFGRTVHVERGVCLE